MKNITGQIWGIGVGPGDPDLMTLKAHRILQVADVIAYPAPAGSDSLVRSIAAPHIPTGAEEFVISTPMDVARHPAQDVYDWATDEIGKMADAGKSVVILCEGDPFFYGSFMYLYSRLSGSYDVKVVPGVSSVNACAAELGIPLAARNDVISAIPATLDAETLKVRLRAADTASIIKAGRHLKKVKQVLDTLGVTDNAMYIERATMDNQRILPLSQVSEDTAPYFSMVIVQLGGETRAL
ncbi:MAG: precorrin-2 C(20)-methyltransferase [Rhodospirillales bacterium]|nr:precorrin-2 C(20)-methyltransferase [Rhodospirillales bacterium]